MSHDFEVDKRKTVINIKALRLQYQQSNDVTILYKFLTKSETSSYSMIILIAFMHCKENKK